MQQSVMNKIIKTTVFIISKVGIKMKA